jgi:uncharacterized protein (DUF1501 family)
MPNLAAARAKTAIAAPTTAPPTATFLLGGRVKGGLYGQTAPLAGLTDGNLPYAIDFRQLYSTVVQDWWGKDARQLFGQRFDRLPLLRA